MINLFSKHALSYCSFIKVISINLIKLYFKATATAMRQCDEGKLVEEENRQPVAMAIPAPAA
ncbi:hypothetical protein [Bacillus nakamurai]|uniref:hypothetical protein n=1 Tax=Bacillus nakamurai TaxID=1793963 RepID=UPI001E571A5E|nr:hypothetical protein [Bacillus nakamurai]MCC9023220.1 hypothetical protein [Bacillus nakamurai]MCP6681667.1 hypothetical protein [Bacillus nakamurai]